jgi:uncharacterized membrane protein
MTRRNAVLGVLAGLALAAGVRFYHLGLEDFWQDEIHSLFNSAGTRGVVESLPTGTILRGLPRYADLTAGSTPLSVWRTMSDDSHPPMYFLLLLGWRGLVGDGEAAVRTMPVVFSILSIVPLALIAFELRRPRLAGLLTLLSALSYTHTLMGQENRPYSLSLLLVSTSFWLVKRMETRWGQWSNGARWLHATAYGLIVFLAPMTHYFSVLALMGQGVYALLRLRGAARTAWALSVAVAALAFCALWVPQLLAQRDFIASQDWLIERAVDHTERTILRLADLPTRQLFLTKFSLDATNSLTGVSILGAACLMLWFFRASEAVIFACWFFFPVSILAAVDFTTQQRLLTHVRYSSAAIPGLVGLIAVAIDRLPRPGRWIAIIAFCAGTVRTLYHLPAQHNPHSRAAATLIASDLRPRDLIIYDAIDWPGFWPVRLFQMVSYYLPYNPPSLLLHRTPDDGLKAEFAKFDAIYVVTPRVRDNAPEIPDYLRDSHPVVLASGQIFEIGWVYRFSRADATASDPSFVPPYQGGRH